MYEEWRGHLERPNTPGEFTKLMLVPNLEIWMNRKFGGMTFHLTQVMTGHDCFAKFVYRIGKRKNTSCDLCGEDVDDVLHTLKECPAWDPERIELRRALELDRDFVLGDILEAMLTSEEKWNSFSTFVEKVMREKEDEERIIARRDNTQSSPIRRLRLGLVTKIFRIRVELPCASMNLVHNPFSLSFRFIFIHLILTLILLEVYRSRMVAFRLIAAQGLH